MTSFIGSQEIDPSFYEVKQKNETKIKGHKQNKKKSPQQQYVNSSLILHEKRPHVIRRILAYTSVFLLVTVC